MSVPEHYVPYECQKNVFKVQDENNNFLPLLLPLTKTLQTIYDWSSISIISILSSRRTVLLQSEG